MGLPPRLQHAVVAIGNFDGVHRGHREVLTQAAMRAKTLEAKLAVLTFEPHPRRFFDKENAPKRLTPLAAKLRLLAEAGVDIAYVLPFNAALAELPAEQFVHQVLVQALQAKDVVTGDAFVFGKGRTGSAKLIAAGAEFSRKYTALAVPALVEGGAPVSSSRIRAHLAQGELAQAAALLGREFSMEGPVIRGDQRARMLGYPTANIAVASFKATPAFGVYAVRVRVQGQDAWHNAIANLGVRPTFGGGRALLEVNLLGQSLDLYGKQLEVRFLTRLREEKRFETVAMLAAQIARDATAARAWFAKEA